MLKEQVQRAALPRPLASQPGFAKRVAKDFKKNKWIYFMLLPIMAYYVIFHYLPMYGVQIAFKNFSASQGIWSSPWAGFDHFQSLFNSFYFYRILTNTLLISLYDLIFAFPASIVLALLMNEIRQSWYKRTVQSLTYMPHFISLVVVVGIILDFLSSDGLINNIYTALSGKDSILFMQRSEFFRTIYIGSGIWQQVGWGSIIYLAAISNLDPSLYEAAKVDGASRFKQLLHITLPGLIPIITILFILRIGSLMVVGDEKILLMYNSSIYETADVIGTYVYRKGILSADYSYSAAVGLFNSVINFVLLVFANSFSRKLNGNSLW
ncbi:ABC transporter permease [Paenibacillus sp. GCM10027626]|uniref:ABC transporter permease n=1 Tax=Paenibacillus sp. GCM10027626 TaxID=3273411 RepID=UPI00363C7968